MARPRQWLASAALLAWAATGSLVYGACAPQFGDDQGTTIPVGAKSYFSAEEHWTPTLSILVDCPELQAETIKEAALHAWLGYVRNAWGRDELLPLTGEGEDTFGGVGATIVDSLSTLYIMGLKDEYQRARNWVESELDFDRVGEVIVFETVIRILGGLLSAYQLSGDEMFLAKSEDLGRRLGKSFASKSGLPYPRCDLNSTACSYHSTYGRNVLLAEIGTLQLEFRALSYHTSDDVLCSLRERVEDIIRRLQRISPKQNKGMLPFLLSIDSGLFVNQYITLGSPSDSYFEYLLKTWVQGGKQEDEFRDMYLEVVDGIFTYMRLNLDNGVTFLREYTGGPSSTTKMDHFTCYVPAILLLGLDLAPSTEYEQWFSLAKNLTNTCYGMYHWSNSGLAAEHIEIYRDGSVSFEGGYLLRPEAIEALFYMWRTTHDQKYRRWSWRIFQKIQEWCRTEHGFATLLQANEATPEKGNLMPSFFLAETLKYLYLTFSSDELIPFEHWVFNTEGHPLLITPGLRTTETS